MSHEIGAGDIKVKQNPTKNSETVTFKAPSFRYFLFGF